MATLEELTTPLTKEEVEASIYSALQAYGIRTSGWKPGAVVRTIIAGASIVMAAFSSLQANIATGGFLELAEGSWLEIVALQVYGVEKNNGTFATGNVSFTNTGGGVFNVAVGDVIVKNTSTGKTYKNTEAFTLAAFEANKIVEVQAEEIGSDSTAEAGDIDDLETTLLAVTVTNPTAIVGQDEESDPALRSRCRAKTGTLSPNGPKDAYRFIAVSTETSDGVPAGVTRVTTVADGVGGVTAYIATASGAVAGVTGDSTTPFGAVEDAIHTLVEPIGIIATVLNASVLTIPITYTAYIKNSTTIPAEVEAAIAVKLAEVMAELPIGGSKVVAGPGFVYTDLLEAAITSVIGVDNLVDLNMTSPASDVSVASSEAPVLGTVTASVVVVTV